MTLSRKVRAQTGAALLVGFSMVASMAFSAGQVTAQIPEDVGEVQTTASGLKYSVLKAGTGTRKPAGTEQVRVHYTGWLASDGTKFDSSRDRGEPATFGLNQVIAGWTEGLQLMTAGARFKFTIPWSLAYGQAGRPPQIPAEADLVFDVELLEMQPAMPAFKPEKATKTESGIEWVVTKKGNGTKFTDGDVYQLQFTVFDSEGVFMDGSWRRNGSPIPAGAIAQIKCLQEVAPLMEVGSTWQLRVPSALGGMRGKAGDTENWVLTMLPFKKVAKAPDFVLPADDELTVTESGLKYKVIAEGDGSAKPVMGQSVTCHYSGWLTDGTPFDSSFKRGEPSSFQLGRVIPGWNEGLALMSPGAKYLFVIPSELGYGQNPRPGGVIKPGDTLVFFVELIKVGN